MDISSWYARIIIRGYINGYHTSPSLTTGKPVFSFFSTSILVLSMVLTLSCRQCARFSGAPSDDG